MRIRERIGFALVIISLLMLVGCNSEKNSHSNMDMGSNDSLTPVLVDLSVQPEQIKVKDKIMIEVLVTQNNEHVNNADKVVIEFVPSNKEGKHVELNAEHAGEGKYVLETSLDKADTYTVISHVTVGAMHSMPKKEIVVTE
ncbi:FixH family protein [Paenibacillus sp. CMAA1364]